MGQRSVLQLVINTARSIVTFLIVFLIQHTQSRKGDAIRLSWMIWEVAKAENSWSYFTSALYGASPPRARS
ncbi:MAG: low affinity iron permease family protein [Methylohalobius sp.]|nr:low affinity iron permease family protein [Methylohalobius sp.]